MISLNYKEIGKQLEKEYGKKVVIEQDLTSDERLDRYLLFDTVEQVIEHFEKHFPTPWLLPNEGEKLYQEQGCVFDMDRHPFIRAEEWEGGNVQYWVLDEDFYHEIGLAMNKKFE